MPVLTRLPLPSPSVAFRLSTCAPVCPFRGEARTMAKQVSCPLGFSPPRDDSRKYPDPIVASDAQKVGYLPPICGLLGHVRPSSSFTLADFTASWLHYPARLLRRAREIYPHWREHLEEETNKEVKICLLFLLLPFSNSLSV